MWQYQDPPSQQPKPWPTGYVLAADLVGHWFYHSNLPPVICSYNSVLSRLQGEHDFPPIPMHCISTISYLPLYVICSYSSVLSRLQEEYDFPPMVMHCIATIIYWVGHWYSHNHLPPLPVRSSYVQQCTECIATRA